MEEITEETTEPKKRLILRIEDDGEKCHFTCDKGTCVEEMAFCIAAFIKVLIRDGIIKNDTEFISLVEKYYADPQYNEVKEYN